MKTSFLLGLLASSLLMTGIARADTVPPDVWICNMKSVGTACTYNNASGTCQNATCSKLDYANWDRDASTSPPTTQYECVRCVTSGTDAGTTPAPVDDDSACSVGGRSTASHVAPWLLAGTFPLLMLLIRRRRRR